jgi:hypothetical protein
MAIGYVALWGNDNNSGVDWENAKRTLQGSKDGGMTTIYAKGYYNEAVTFISVTGTPNVILDGTFLSNGANNAANITNGIYQNYSGYAWNINLDHAIFRHSTNASMIQNSNVDNSIIHDSLSWKETSTGADYQYNTYHNIPELYLTRKDGVEHANIISNSNIEFPTKYLKYSLIINSPIKFTGGGLGFDETVYTLPTGVDDAAKLADLKSRMVIVYGAGTYLPGCRYYSGSYNDVFTNADNEDFTLIPNCIAANMAYDGSFIGAKGIGINIEFDSIFNSITNISTAASTLGYVEDQEIDATCISNILDLGVIKNVCTLSNLGALSYRNGMQINTVTNLGTSISAGTDLVVDESYEVIENTVTYNTVTYNPWECFVVVTGVTEFTGTGYLRKVDQDNYDEKIQIKVSKTDPTLSGVATLTVYLHQDIQINEDVSGIPTFGNADIGYVPGSAVDLDTRYVQILPIIKALNLPAR